MRIAIVIPHGHCFGEVGATSIDLCAMEFSRYSKHSKTTMFFVNPVIKPLHEQCIFYKKRDLLDLQNKIKNFAPDIIVVHQNLKYAYFLAKGMKVPVVLHRHNYYERKSTLSSWNKARQFNRLAGVIFVSHSVADLFSRNFPLVKIPVHVVHNGIDTAIWWPSEVRDPVIVFAGRAHPTKGARQLLEALIKVLPNFSGWTAKLYVSRGSLNPEEFSQITQLSERLPDKISLIRDAPLTNVKAALEVAAISVMPTQDPEPFGRSAIEAMAGGAALIASKLGGLSEVLSEHANIGLDDVSSQSIANALTNLIEDTDKLKKLSVLGRQHVEKNFEIREASKSLDFIYKNLTHN